MTILLDINLLPREFSKDLKGVEDYSKKYSVTVIPYDSNPEITGFCNSNVPIVISN